MSALSLPSSPHWLIDPYPRKPGLDYADRIESDPSADKKPSPFAVLQGLKRDDSAS
jgi:uncharacterized metal-binding protein YceD (DUF177 family)